MEYCYNYPRPSVTTDCIILQKKENQWNILLIERAADPFKGSWALPGGFLEMQETLEQCAARELEEETGLTDIALWQVHAFSALHRDPRGRTISILFWGIAKDHQHAKAGDDAKNLQWFSVNKLPSLAFDHDHVVATALDKIKLP